jgi:hypothetical protein
LACNISKCFYFIAFDIWEKIDRIQQGLFTPRLTSMSNPNNTTSEFNGTTTIALNEGPVENVPVSIKRIDNNVISIWADPIKINNHFGSIPTFGTIEKLVKVEK